MTARPFRMISAQESGIGGFLLLFAIILVINLVSILIQIPGYAMSGTIVASTARIYPPYPYVVLGELILLIVRAVGSIVGLVLIFRKDQRAPVFFVGFFGFVAAMALIDMYFGSRLGDAVHAYLIQQGQSAAAYDEKHHVARLRNIGSLGWTVAWLLYWRSSERVRLTFTPGPGMTEIPTPT